MSLIDQLIAELAPHGVEFRQIGASIGINFGTRITKSADAGNLFPVYGGGGESFRTDEWNREDEYVVSRFAMSESCVRKVTGRFWMLDSGFTFDPLDHGVDKDYIGYVLLNMQPTIYATGSQSAQKNLKTDEFRRLRIPVPPIEVQREIVRILDQFTQLEAELEAELEARRRQYVHYRHELLDVGSASAFRPLGELARNLDSRRKPVTRGVRTAGDIPYYGASGVVDRVSDYIFDGDYLLVSEDGANLLARSTPIAFSISGKTWVNNHAHVLEFETYAERRFVEIYLNSIDLAPYISGAAQPKLNKANLNIIPVPDPPLAEKERVVGLLDKFDALVNDLNVGLPAEVSTRRKQYEYYRDKLLTFEEVAS